MGRYYDGDIQGKFWFGIQSSNDIEQLIKINGVQRVSWLVCGCNAEVNVDDYCKQCYGSKEEHIETAIENKEFNEDDNATDRCLYREDQMITYELDSSHYQELVDNMKTLKTTLPEETIAIFDEIEQTDKILDAFTGVFSHVHEMLNMDGDAEEKHALYVLIARYTLGYQLEYCLRKQSKCMVYCEF
jgi:YesN/AraC family two-component response regulator